MAGLTAGASAQKKTYFGIKGGLNMTNISNLKITPDENPTPRSSYVDAKYKSSFYVGIFIEAKISRSLSIQPEFVYSQQGTSATFNIDRATVKYRLLMDYINIPVLFKAYVVPDKLSFDFGPQIGFGVRAEAKAKATANGQQNSASATLDNDVYNNVDFSIPLGFTWNITKHILFSARANIGLTNVLKGTGGEHVSNRVFQIGVGARF